MTASPKRALTFACCSALVLGVGACASKTSTAAFQGEQHAVAQTIANLQTDATAGEQKKICTRDLASSLVSRLNAAPGGCALAVKEQLAEIDNLEVTVESVQVRTTSAAATATARVRSTYGGKHRHSTVSLRKEAGSWKIAGVQ
jgi:Protein of unknown function (DUF3828)